MPKIKLKPEERDELIRLEKQIKDKAIGIRIRIILALDLGYSNQEVSDILLVNEDTVNKWKRKYFKGRLLSDWLQTNHQGYSGRLSDDQLKQVEEFVKDGVITDCQEVVEYIRKNFGVRYTIDGVTKLLHRLKFVYKQTVVIPSKLDTQKQAEFLQRYEQLKAKLKANEKILFMDGVHPTHNTHQVRCWVKKGENKTIKTNTGRSRLNIQGAYEIENTQVVTHFSDTINTVTVIEFLDKIQAHYWWCAMIYLICDNATYYKNKLVQEYLARPGCCIKLIFLPSYSPNLNFIERLWKYMHQKVIGVKYREKFKEFDFDIRYFFDHLDEHQEAIQSFVGNRLHLITA